MVKRAKLTLGVEPVEVEVEEEAQPRSSDSGAVAPEKEAAAAPQAPAGRSIQLKSALGKTLLVAGLTVVSLIIFRKKLF